MDKNKRNMLIGVGVCTALAGSYLLYKKCNKVTKVEETSLMLNDETIKSHIDFVTSKDTNLNIYFGMHLNRDTFAYVTELNGEVKLNILNIKKNSINLATEILENTPMKFGVVRLRHKDKNKVFYTITDVDGMITANIYTYSDRKIELVSYTKLESDIERDDIMHILLQPTYHGGYLHQYEYLDEDYIINNELMELIDIDFQ